MSTHNIGFYEEMAKIIFQLSNITLSVLRTVDEWHKKFDIPINPHTMRNCSKLRALKGVFTFLNFKGKC